MSYMDKLVYDSKLGIIITGDKGRSVLTAKRVKPTKQQKNKVSNLTASLAVVASCIGGIFLVILLAVWGVI